MSKNRIRILAGLVIMALAGLLVFTRPWLNPGLVERPVGSGAVGAIHVYGQNQQGAFRIFPGRLTQLDRPQHLAFELHVDGTGPRSIYIELDTGQNKWRMFNERIEAPKTNWYLDFVMDLDENVPNNLSVIVRVDAPHAKAVESRFPIRLTRKKPK